MTGKELIKRLDKHLGELKTILMNDVLIDGKLEKREKEEGFVTRYKVNNDVIISIYHNEKYSFLDTGYSIVIKWEVKK